MIRIIAKPFAVTIVLTAFLHAAPLFAAQAVWVSNTGSDLNPCTPTSPCQTIPGGFGALDSFGQINCLNAPRSVGSLGVGSTSATVDCESVWQPPMGSIALILSGNTQWEIRNVTFSGSTGGFSAIKVTGSGTLILENCVFENFTAATALDIEPTGPLNLIIKNSRLSSNASGVLIKPAAGGSVTATFDGVTLADNTGGGLKADTTNGPVTIDITDSVVSKNGGNGINAIGATNQNMVSIKNSVINKNAVAGVQANGANAGVLVQTTLFDQNASGATSVVGGGHISTYGNNSIVGSSGSGFTGTASLQ